MKKIVLAIFISTLFILNTKAQISYHIYGTIDRTDVDKIYLNDAGVKTIDTILVKSGSFNIKGNYKSPAVVMMAIITKTRKRSHKIILDNGDYNITIDADLNFNVVSTSGLLLK